MPVGQALRPTLASRLDAVSRRSSITTSLDIWELRRSRTLVYPLDAFIPDIIHPVLNYPSLDVFHVGVLLLLPSRVRMLRQASPVI